MVKRVVQVYKMIIKVEELRARVWDKSKGMKGYINLKAIKFVTIRKPNGAT